MIVKVVITPSEGPDYGMSVEIEDEAYERLHADFWLEIAAACRWYEAGGDPSLPPTLRSKASAVEAT